jgi:opacity protein-like surface antigen
MKKVLLLLVILTVLAGVVTAQEGAHKNAIYFGTTDILGLALGYERMLRPNLSLMVDAGAALVLVPSFYAASRLRWYPVSDSDGKTYGLFVSAGLGYDQFEKDSSIFLWEKDEEYDMYGLLISPGIGIKIGFGKPKGFVFNIGVDFDVVLGEKTRYNYNEYDEIKTKSGFGVGFNPNIKLLFGFGF